MFGGLEPKQKNLKAFSKGITVKVFSSVFPFSFCSPFAKIPPTSVLVRTETKRVALTTSFS